MSRLLALFLCGTLLSLTVARPALAELDDSSLFMEAFTAFQHKDYLLSIEKLGQLNQQFPDSPLRDVSLLMQARSEQRAGDNEAAGRAVNQFLTEFGSSTLAQSVEDELLTLGKRQKAGERLMPNRHLQLAAQQVRTERLALERAATERAERERLAREKAEQVRLAREKAEGERRERERRAAIKAARAAIRCTIELPAGPLAADAGSAVTVPFGLTNRSPAAEPFTVTGIFPKDLDGTITAADHPQQGLPPKILLQPGERFKGELHYTIPGNLVDGSRQSVGVTAASATFTDLVQTRIVPIAAQAPLLRAVAKLQQPIAAAGDKLGYRVTILNVGSRPAREVDLRITLPPQLKLLDAGAGGCWIETEQLAACRISTIGSGTLSERLLTVAVRHTAKGQNLRGTVEVLQTVLQTKDTFPGVGFSIKAP